MIKSGTATARCRLFVIVWVGALALSACGDEDEVETQRSAQNRPPALTGTPPAAVVAGSEYSYKFEAADPDNDALIFGIDGRPQWAEFDALTGTLSGEPGPDDVGTYRGVVVWVTDGDTEALLSPFDIVVEPAVAVANSAPTISGSPANSVVAGEAYRFVPLSEDADGDVLVFTIRNLPPWAAFDGATGTVQGTPPMASAGTYRDIVIAVGDGQTTTTLSPFEIVVRVPGVNTAPSISGEPMDTVAAGTDYAFVPSASDVDGDLLTFAVANLPPWASFDPSTGELAGLPDEDEAGTYDDIVIQVSDGVDSDSLAPFSIVVTATTSNTPPTISGVPSSSGAQGEEYAFTPAASDADGDPLTFSISNRPPWADFDPDTGTLSGRPDADDAGRHSNIVIRVSDGAATAALPTFWIQVEARNSPPLISGSPGASVQQGAAYVFTPTASDPDGDALTFSIQNRPGWASFDTGSGQLSGTPGASDVGTYDGIRIGVGDGGDTAVLPAFSIEVTGAPVQNSPPTITGSPPGAVQSGVPYTFTPTASDPDGDTLTFGIANRPSWATFSNSTGRLQGTPGAGGVGTYSDIRITASDGTTTASLPPFSITVAAPEPTNRAPTMTGSPPTSITQGQQYSFTPTASDPDGDALTFGIVNRPPWTSFSTSTGRLQGTPGAGAVGTHSGIRITVTDGEETATLPAFSITVDAAEPENRAPTISGSPVTTVVQGTHYAFQPNASDPDGDTLAFTVQNLPSWASFDTSNGRVSGTPSGGDLGTYSDIRIRVSDGDAEASLPAFAIAVEAIAVGSATLSWGAPTERTDGSQLTDLAGFKIYWGTSPGDYANTVSVGSGTVTYVIDNLAPGTWYFATTAVDSQGLESDYSNVASKTIQ